MVEPAIAGVSSEVLLRDPPVPRWASLSTAERSWLRLSDGIFFTFSSLASQSSPSPSCLLLVRR